jgi:CHASE3 domain sensor protein
LLGSFILLTVLVIGMSIFSIVQINKSADGFKDYREMAIDAIVANDVQANMLMVRLNVLDYMARPADNKAKRFQEYYGRTEQVIQQAQTQMQNPTRAKLVDQIESGLNQYYKGFSEIQALVAQRNEIVFNTLMPTARKWSSF